MQVEEHCGHCDESEELGLPVCVLEAFEAHTRALRVAVRDRRKAVQLRNVVEDNEREASVTSLDNLGKRQPSDKYDGDVNLRTLRTLLLTLDNRGWER
jgi:hypothetical protein